MLKNELDYFKKNQNDLVSQFKGKTLVIKGEQVVGVYESALQAFLAASGNYELGTFLIQTCVPGPSAYTVTLSSHELFPIS